MKFNYDLVADVAAFQLNDDEVFVRYEIPGGVVVGMAQNGNVVCIEVFDFTRQYPIEHLRTLGKYYIPMTVSRARLMDEPQMRREYPRYCAEQEKLGKRPWEDMWERAKNYEFDDSDN